MIQSNILQITCKPAAMLSAFGSIGGPLKTGAFSCLLFVCTHSTTTTNNNNDNNMGSPTRPCSPTARPLPTAAGQSFLGSDYYIIVYYLIL